MNTYIINIRIGDKMEDMRQSNFICRGKNVSDILPLIIAVIEEDSSASLNLFKRTMQGISAVFDAPSIKSHFEITDVTDLPSLQMILI